MATERAVVQLVLEGDQRVMELAREARQDLEKVVEKERAAIVDLEQVETEGAAGVGGLEEVVGVLVNLERAHG